MDRNDYADKDGQNPRQSFSKPSAGLRYLDELFNNAKIFEGI